MSMEKSQWDHGDFFPSYQNQIGNIVFLGFFL
jgi:hypothetical protein